MPSFDYTSDFDHRVDAIHPNASSNLHMIAEIPIEKAHDILRQILEMGCMAQNMLNIESGRKAITKIPENWLLNNFPIVVSKYMFGEKEWQEWEFRRLAEMLEAHFPRVFEWLIYYAKSLDNPEVDEAICDFLK
ncbi:MAG: hypothetical protein LBV33_08190 [Lachnospiraceae bacterium]|nr:hypothetical protein [Lachnospiraceae bacterium]